MNLIWILPIVFLILFCSADARLAWILPAAFVILLVAALVGVLPLRLFTTDSTVRGERVAAAPEAPATLYVLVHGMAPKRDEYDILAEQLARHGQVLHIGYAADATSNADPHRVAREIAERIDEAVRAGGANRLVLIANSMGAPLARRALLDHRAESWATMVSRMVLLAGLSRGWDLTGEPPPDGNPVNWFGMRFLYWAGRLLGGGHLAFALERGAPFIADLRLDWMRWQREVPEERRIEAVQILGDHDDLVSSEDDADLRAAAVDRYALVRTRATGHDNSLDFGRGSRRTEAQRRQGQYRLDRIVFSATQSFDQVRRLDDQSPPATDQSPPVADHDVTEVIFVLQGLRDLGRWSADLESAIARRDGRHTSIVIVLPRHGHFGMGPLLFEASRQRYLRSLMDAYTETLAHYPNVRPDGIRFFAHSNATYLLAKALADYRSMAARRVVLAGSVVRSDYRWDPLRGRVERIRNYVAADDWVVGLFPRLFELPPFRWLGNDLGGSGFSGFDRVPAQAGGPTVENVKYVRGGHGAFDDRVDEIAAYLLDAGDPSPARVEERHAWSIGGAASWVMVLLAWGLLAAALVFVGVRVVGAAAAPAWPALLLFLLLVVRILQTA